MKWRMLAVVILIFKAVSSDLAEPTVVGRPIIFPNGHDSETIYFQNCRNKLLIQVDVNDKFGGTFILDTKCGYTAITPFAAKMVGLTDTYRINPSFDGTAQPEMAVAKSITVGSTDAKLFPMIISTRAQYDNPITNGVIGADYFGRSPYAINFQESTMTMYAPGKFVPPVDATELKVKPNSLVPFFAADIEGQTAWLGLDTTFNRSVYLSPLFVNTNRHLVDGHIHIDHRDQWESADEKVLYSSRWKDFNAFGKKNKTISGAYQKDMNRGGDGYIGTNYCRDLQLFIDPNANKAWAKWHDPMPLEKLLKHLGDPKGVDLAGATPLINAALDLRSDAVKVLLEKGADVNTKAMDGMSALGISAGRDDLETTRLLLAARADVHARTKIDGFTPLLLAAQFAHEEKTTAMLLEAGADIREVSTSGRSALFLAAEAGNAATVRLLLQNRALIDAGPPSGETPLCAACANSNLECATILLEHGAEPNAIGIAGTPLTLAAKWGSADCLSLLLKKGAKIDLQNKVGETALIVAVSGNHPQCVYKLLEAGADRKIKANNGETAKDRAIKMIHPVVLQLLAVGDEKN